MTVESPAPLVGAAEVIQVTKGATSDKSEAASGVGITADKPMKKIVATERIITEYAHLAATLASQQGRWFLGWRTALYKL